MSDDERVRRRKIDGATGVVTGNRQRFASGLWDGRARYLMLPRS